MLKNESMAAYFRERRKTIGQFNVPISRAKLNLFSEHLKEKNKTKTAWLNEKIDEELNNNL